MSINTPDNGLSLELVAQKYAEDNYGVPIDWQHAPSITQNQMSENIQEAYKEGYNSRDEEVKELVTHIQKMFSWNAWDGENLECLREATKIILTKYPQ